METRIFKMDPWRVMVGFAKIELGWKLDHQGSFKTSRPSRLRVIPGSEILAREAAKNAKGK